MRVIRGINGYICLLRETEMELDLTKLMKFDLVDDVELTIKGDFNRLIEFYDIYQKIMTNDEFIRDCPSNPGSTDKIFRSELISSIGATLAIEGTKLTEQEIEESIQKADLSIELEKKEQEAQNSKKAYENIIKIVSEYHKENDGGKFIYNEGHIKNIHRDITEGIDYMHNVPGEYRDINPIFGEPPKRSLCTKKYTVDTAISKLIEWLNKKGSGPLSNNPFVKATMAHYYISEIHPFADGNGRTARALEALVLYVNGINTYCFWSLANFWSVNRNEYLVRLGNIRATCDPWEFIIWGMKGYLNEIVRIKSRVLNKAKKLMLMDYVRWLYENKNNQPREKKINQRIVGVLGILIRTGEVPYKKFMSFPELKLLCHTIKASTKARDLTKMEKLGLIKYSLKENIKYIGPNYILLEHLNYY